MKKIILLIALFYSFSFGQGWNSTVTTTISESTLEKMDLFTNKDGNHLLIKRANGNIVYYNLNSLGTVITSKTATLESNGDFPTVTGTNDIVYAFYKVGNYIKLKYSTNGGISWIYNSNLDRYIGSNECNGIDAIYEIVQGVHLVWGTRGSGSDFETYYYRLTPDLSWADGKNVTDYSGGVGGNPTVVFSQDRIHVSYNMQFWYPPVFGAMKTRDKYNGVWQTAQFISTTDESIVERLVVLGSYLYAIYGKYISPADDYVDLLYKSRTLSGTWSTGSGTVIDYAILEDQTSMNVCKTYNDKLQLVYIDDGPNFYHRSFDGSWSGTFTLDGNQNFALVSKGLSNASNDVFVTWKRYTDGYIRYRQYDAYPLPPQGLAVQPYQQGNNIYARLTWSFNNEPDVYITSNAYEISRRTKPYNGSWSNWSVIDYVGGDENEYIDYDINYVGADAYVAEYKIRAKDYNNRYSPYSSVVSITFGRFAKINADVTSSEYELSQNFPNPFNPTTRIDYSIKESGMVILKVYDMLGTEVASLVNETKEPGNYSVIFNAENLPSGIYVYKLTADKFVETKKLILLK